MRWRDPNGEWWEDLRFPAQGINPVGGAADPGRDEDTGLLSFSGVLDNLIAGFAQMPHAWKSGTPVRPHLHLRFPTSAAANTRWSFGYDKANVSSDFSNLAGVFTTLSTITVANPTNVYRHVIGSFGDLSMAGLRASAGIPWKVSRLANSDAADTDTNDCLLLEFDIHVRIWAPGTRGEFS